jgi:flagellar protein FlaJ
MPKIEPKDKRLVAATSIVLGLLIAITALLSVSVLRASNLPLDWDQLLIVGIIIAVFPPAVVEFLDMRWQRGIDKNIPRLLREIAESGRTGLTLVRAIEVSSERDYGPLTPELKRLVAQISWGSSLEDSLRDFANRAKTKLARRTSTLISEVARSGGDTQEIMEQVNRHIGELASIDRERYAQMRPYAAVVYIALGVFLFTDIILIRTFFTQIVELQSKVLQTSGGGTGIFGGISSVDIKLLKKVLFHATIIQAVIGGLVAGKMSEAKLGAGLKHVLALLMICFVAFLIYVWGA